MVEQAEERMNKRDEETEAMEAERALGRNIAVGLPLVTVVLAIVAGELTSIGPAILVLAAGALVGAIALFWTSLRTLAGDAALPEELELLASRPLSHAPADARKQLLLRALKDLEHDHAVGKIDQEDYEDLAARYRAEAKAVMRELDEVNEPLRQKAEEIARAHLAKRGLGPETAGAAKGVESSDATTAEPAVAEAPTKTAAAKPSKRTCAACSTENDADARFCKSCAAPFEATTTTATE